MNLQTIITSLLAGKVGTKIFGNLGKRFGLSPEKMTMILTIGIPILLKIVRSRKSTKSVGNVIKGKVK